MNCFSLKWHQRERDGERERKRERERGRKREAGKKERVIGLENDTREYINGGRKPICVCT